MISPRANVNLSSTLSVISRLYGPLDRQIQKAPVQRVFLTTKYFILLSSPLPTRLKTPQYNCYLLERVQFYITILLHGVYNLIVGFQNILQSALLYTKISLRTP